MIFGQFILSGYYFGDEGPVLKLDDLVAGKRVKMNVLGEQLTIEVSKDYKYCIGRFELGKVKSQPCPDARKVGDRMETCQDCFKAIGFNPSFYNVGREELSEAQKEYNSKPHKVYLAYFAPSVVKVGISSASRGRLRWLEQGARAVADLGEYPDAYSAREVEARVSGFGLSETIRRDKKRKLLSGGFDFEKARNELERIMTEHNLEGEVLDLSSFYHSDVVDDPTDMTSNDPMIISGKVVSQIGDILIAEQDGVQFMLGLKSAVGRQVSIGSDIVRLEGKVKQIGLF